MQYSIPSHVPAELVRNVDIFDLPGGHEDVHLAWKRVQDENPDLFYTPCHGGHWVMARAELINLVYADFKNYSSAGAIAIPDNPPDMPPMIPIASDPPDHKAYRLPISQALAPKKVESYAIEARELAIELIEGFKPKGECEFIEEFAGFLPMTIFLRMMDLPQSDRVWLMEATSVMVREVSVEKRAEVGAKIFGYLGGWIAERMKSPGADLISEIARIKVGDRPLSPAETVGECAQVLFGGLDTVAGTMGFIARFLAENPGHRRQLVESPDKIPRAIEELLRRHSIPNLARRVMHDMVVNGVRIPAGDKIIMPICLHGLDERAWPDSLTVDFDRPITEHFAFGKGVHKCPGANLARTELRIYLEEWLQRIPDFSIKPGARAETLPGMVMSVGSLPLVWTV